MLPSTTTARKHRLSTPLVIRNTAHCSRRSVVAGPYTGSGGNSGSVNAGAISMFDFPSAGELTCGELDLDSDAGDGEKFVRSAFSFLASVSGTPGRRCPSAVSITVSCGVTEKAL